MDHDCWAPHFGPESFCGLEDTFFKGRKQIGVRRKEIKFQKEFGGPRQAKQLSED